VGGAVDHGMGETRSVSTNAARIRRGVGGGLRLGHPFFAQKRTFLMAIRR
jgi:hypothetical protein